MIDSNPADRLAVPLETERLLLRPIRREDTPFAVRHFTDPEVNHFMLDDEPIMTAEQAVAIVAFYVDRPGDTYNRWVLVRKTDGVALGTCGYHRWNRQHRKAEVGYDLSPAWQGQGYMREAVAAMLAHGFTAMHLHRIEALVAVANARSAHLLRQLGFAHEGVLRESFYSGGQFHDHALYARLSHAEG